MPAPTCTHQITEAALEAFEGDGPQGFAALELLPKALALLSASGDEVAIAAGDGGDTATCRVADVCASVVGRVCKHSWPLASIARVLASLRSFPL